MVFPIGTNVQVTIFPERNQYGTRTGTVIEVGPHSLPAEPEWYRV